MSLRRLTACIGSCLIVGVGLVGCDRASETTLSSPPPGEPLTYVALGDSYPAGAGPVGGESYVDHYEDLIEQRSDIEVEVTDLSVSGATTEDLMKTISSQQEQAFLQEAQVITITIGGNDFLQTASACRDLACFEGVLPAIETRLTDAAARVRAAAPDALILMTNYPDVVAGNEAALGFLGYGSFEVARDISMRSSELVCSVAERHGMRCVDVYEAFNGADGEKSAWEEGLLATDIIHPSEDGHRLIAQLLCDIACS